MKQMIWSDEKMETDTKVEYCSDMIGLYKGKLVLVERLTFPQGYALPGGRRKWQENDKCQKELEDVRDCALREFKEETGLDLIIEGGLGVYDNPGRDPRGLKISNVVYGKAHGSIRNEFGKTRILLIDLVDVDNYSDAFAFDHYQIIKDWREKFSKNKINKTKNTGG